MTVKKLDFELKEIDFMGEIQPHVDVFFLARKIKEICQTVDSINDYLKCLNFGVKSEAENDLNIKCRLSVNEDTLIKINERLDKLENKECEHDYEFHAFPNKTLFRCTKCGVIK